MTQSGAEPVDYNALNDTPAGQLAQAGFITAMFAVPDVVRSRGARAAAWTGLAAANLATIAVLNARDEDPRNDLTAAVEREPDQTGSPAQTWAVIGGGAALFALSAVASTKLYGAVGRWLRRRGVGAPFTLMGAVAAFGYVASKQLNT